MCNAFSEQGHNVVLFAERTLPQKETSLDTIKKHYGLNLSNVSLCSFYSKFKHQTNLKIALIALLWIIFQKKKEDIIFTRNLYFATFWSLISSEHFFYETHQPEKGFRKKLQKIIFKRNHCTIISISNALTEILRQQGIALQNNKVIILHDCASSSISKWSQDEISNFKTQHFQNDHLKGKKMVGYFGHLYKGRGIEIVEQLSQNIPDALFFVFGGNEEEIKDLKERNQSSNLIIMGFVLPQLALNYMRAMDILLMPYQKKVFISSQGGVDTSQWMSPMKMFEYMASNVPIISSDLPVLREVLHNNENSLLVPPEDIESWVVATKKLIHDEKLSASLAIKARDDFEKKYTWDKRTQEVLTHAL